jgi:hypothetical protein
MARRDRTLAVSAQQIDPLSWFTGPLLPLALAALILTYGTVVSVVTWGMSGQPWLQPIAVVLCASACGIVYIASRPTRQPIGALTASLIVAVAIAGVHVSAIGYSAEGIRLEQWWGPSGLTVVIASLAPYLGASRLLVLGSLSTAVSVGLTLPVLSSSTDAWGVVGSALIIAYAPILGIAAAVTFSFVVVNTMRPLIESRSQSLIVGTQLRDAAAELTERATLARLTARAAPFLEAVADSGRVSPEDRALAGQLARRLRDELVTQSNVSWLDSIADTSRLVVVDPDRRARRMNSAQRASLLGLLQAIIDTPGTDNESLMIELRKGPDGSTAVGVSLDMALPEGRRILHLAPYYLTLKTAVDDLTVGRDGISFRIASEG